MGIGHLDEGCEAPNPAPPPSWSEGVPRETGVVKAFINCSCFIMRRGHS